MNKQAFLSALTLKRTSVEVDGIGTVHFREFTAREAAIFEAMAADTVDTVNRTVKSGEQLFELSLYTIVTCMTDEEGHQFWEADDRALLQDIPKSVIEQIADAILELSGMGKKSAQPKTARGK